MIYYIDFAVGSDGNSGLDWNNPKRNVQSLFPVAGDEIRIAKTSDPVARGVATWTKGSPTVQFSSPHGSSDYLISTSGAAYAGDDAWYYVTGAGSNYFTIGQTYNPLRPGYTGETKTVQTYTRGLVGIIQQVFDFNGDVGNPILISGGWNKDTGFQDGETYVSCSQTAFIGATTGPLPYRSNITIRRLNPIACGNRGFELRVHNLTLEASDSNQHDNEGFFTLGTDTATNRTNVTIRNIVLCGNHGITCSQNGILNLVFNNVSGNYGHGKYSHHYYNPDTYNPATRSYVTIGRANYNGGDGLYWESYNNCEVVVGEACGNGAYGVSLGGDYNNTLRVYKATGNQGEDIYDFSRDQDLFIARNTTINSTIYLYDYGLKLVVGTNSNCVIRDMPIVNPVDALFDAQAIISGRRESGSVITADCATATVGLVSYPTDTTWQFTLSGVLLGDHAIDLYADGLLFDSIVVTRHPSGALTIYSDSATTATGEGLYQFYVNGIPGAEVLGAPAVALRLSQSGIAGAEGFGGAILRRLFTASGIVSSEAIGVPMLLRALVASGVGTAEVLGAGKIVIALAPPGMSSTGASGIPVVVAVLAGQGVDSSETLGIPQAITITGGSVYPPSILGEEAFGDISLSTLLLPSAIDGEEAAGQAAIAAMLAANGIGTEEGAGDSAITLRLAPAGTVGGGMLGQPVINAILAALGVDSAEAAGQDVGLYIFTGGMVIPQGIASGEAVGGPVVQILIREYQYCNSTGHISVGPSTGHESTGPSAGHESTGPSVGHISTGPGTGHEAE